MNNINGRTCCRADQEGSLLGAESDAIMNEKSNGTNSASVTVRIRNKTGLHARPAMQFVDLANKFTSSIRVIKDEQDVNAKSIMELLLLAAGEGMSLDIHAQGPDADEAVEALKKLVESDFNEDEG